MYIIVRRQEVTLHYDNRYLRMLKYMCWDTRIFLKNLYEEWLVRFWIWLPDLVFDVLDLSEENTEEISPELEVHVATVTTVAKWLQKKDELE